MNDIKILGPNGQPLPPMRSKASMLVGGSRVPYDAADSFSDQLANWQPALWSPDNGSISTVIALFPECGSCTQ